MRLRLLALCIFIFPSGEFAYAQQPNAAQTSGGISRQQLDIDRSRRLENRIQTPRPETKKQITDERKIPSGPTQVFIKKILVQDALLLSDAEIKDIVYPYENRELTLEEMQQVADLLTDAYRKKGYVTSRAYIPVQSIKDGILFIKVLEVKSGSVEIRGNRYFKTERLKKDLDVQPGGYFDFSALQRSLVYINEHPDRTAKATLVPGKEPGTTDVVIDVAERRPFHAGFEYDNYGSRFIEKRRYSLVLEHNNLLGLDDSLYIKGQISQDSRLTLEQLRYLFPVDLHWNVGFYAVNSFLKLGKEFDALDAEGSAQVYGVFTNYSAVKNEKVDFRLNLGFDYKSIRNKLLGEEFSHDELRIVKGGFDLDVQDPWGRNILAAGIDSGIPDFWGASEDKDPSASRVGAGGRFDKGNFTFYRLQPMPFSTSLLWKNLAQYSNNNLAASEQFQIGGALSVRGYPPAEHSGDSGIYSALELSVPIYPLSKTYLVPFTKEERLYDDLRFVMFYDIALAHLNNPLAGEEDNETLRGFGVGMRLNIKDYLTFRVEVGYPNGATPSDGDHAHPWIEFTSRF